MTNNPNTILFVSKGPSSPSTRYRATDFFPLFTQHGWQATHWTDSSSPMKRMRLLSMAKRADAVVVVRRTFGAGFACLLRSASKKLIFTFDDAIFAKSDGSSSPGREKRFAATLKVCDQVWAGNGYLAERAKTLNTNVTVLPTSLELDKYGISANKSFATIDLVWIGSSSTKKHLITVLPALETAASNDRSLRLKIIADFSLKSEKLDVISVPWSSETEAMELASAHIGIAPLPDNLFTRGKCGLKVLQYMATRLPVISSPSGVNKDIIKHGVNGFLASNEQEWVDAIRKLASDEVVRNSMGEAGRKHCRSHFALETTFQKMLAALEKDELQS